MRDGVAEGQILGRIETPYVREQLALAIQKMLDKTLERPHVYPTDTPVLVDTANPVAIEGKLRCKEGGKARSVKVHFGENHLCLVLLPKPVARTYGLWPCNSPGDLCIWDPVTGEVHCTDTRGLDEI
jgi:hypothetical protein